MFVPVSTLVIAFVTLSNSLNKVALNLLPQKAKVRAMSGLVFPDPKAGQKIIPENVMWYFYSAQKKAGISHVRFHDLKHTFAIRLVQRECDLYRVSKLLGHKDIKTTQRDAHHHPESLRDGVEILDLLYAENMSRKSADFTFFSRSAKQNNVSD